MRLRQFGFSILLLVGCSTISLAATTFYGPSSYFSSEDVPEGFICRISDDCVHNIEDFEDESIDFGITLSQGQIIGPEFSTGTELLADSVDGDDGAVDGVSGEGHSYFHSGNSITVTFDSPVKSAGLVWTDGDAITLTSFEVFAPDGTSLGISGPHDISDDSFQGTVEEDSFFGAMDPNGIGWITISNVGGLGIEIDHVQFSNCTEPVPEPQGWIMLLVGFLGFVGFRRRR